MKEIVLPYVTIEYTAPIVYGKFSKNAELGFPEIKEFFSCVELIAKNKNYLLFWDTYFIGNITEQGKRILKNYTNIASCKGNAILINKDRSECLQNLIEDYKTEYPLRVFSSGQDAIDWLSTLPLM